MRAASLFGPATAGFSTVLPLLPFLSIFQSIPVHGLSFTSVPSPQLDLSPLGRVALTGDFDAVSIYSYTGQSHPASPNNDNQLILTPLPDGIPTALSSSDGQINAMCSFTQKKGTYEGIFVGGDFTKLGGVEAKSVALYKPDTNEVTALPGLSGSVLALLCDQDTNSVYVGGDFTYGNTSNAVAWVGGKGWSSLSFDGFNGPVESILKNDDGHIIFSGSFDSIGNSTSSNNGQIINLQNATITSDANSATTGFSDPRNIICQASGEAGEGKTWLLADYSPGFWRAYMGFAYSPTKLRLYNTNLDGRGTKDFLFRRLPDGGIMNLTYTDPGSGDDLYCDSSCPLSNSPDEEYRDFHFVNTAGMSGFQIEILDWYGAGAGLNGIELFQDDIFAYAVNAFNEPTCAGIKYPSNAVQTGSWTVTASSQSASSYLTADSATAGASVVFEPDVQQSGDYTVLLSTPGCTDDGTCGSRGIVDVTTSLATAGESSHTLVYQTNLYDKFDTIYTGHVDASDGTFRPRVTLTPASGQGDITVVAWRVQFVLLNATGGGLSGGVSGELNGLYDFDPNSQTSLTKSAINQAGLQLDGSATIRSLSQHDNVIYAGGNFSDSSIRNIMFLDGGNATALPGGGLNSEVASLVVLDNFLYAGGNFTDTSDGGNKNLNHVAAYSFDSKTWSAMGGGVNGPVSHVLSLSLNVSTDVNETIIGVSGDFDQLIAFGDSPSAVVSGFAVWVPSHKNWLQNLNVSQMEFAGQLSAFTTDGNTTLLAGSLASGGIAAASAVSLLYDNGLNLDPLLTSVGGTNSSGRTVTGVYDTTSGHNLTILGGHFITTASDGSIVENLALLNGTDNTIHGLGTGIDSNSTFLALTVSDNTLFAGGNVTGTLGDTVLNGFVVYDLQNNTFAQNVPPPFTGGLVSVNSIAARPGSTEMYFGGDFYTAGALPCPGVCYYDTSIVQWNRPGVSLYGTVLALKWVNNNNLMAVGNLTIAQNHTVVATYDAQKQTWASFDGASTSDIPGAVTAFAPASEDVSNFWLAGEYNNGSSFLANYDGSSFQFARNIFSDGTKILGLEILPLSKNHNNDALLHDDQTLLVTGQLVIPDFGNASAALFNGTALTPFLLTTRSDGQPGSMSQLFYQNKNPYTSASGHHSNGIVVLVAFCCALGCIFLIVFAGVIFNKIQRRRQGYMAAPRAYGTDRPSSMQRVPPEYLFGTLNQRNPAAPAI